MFHCSAREPTKLLKSTPGFSPSVASASTTPMPVRPKTNRAKPPTKSFMLIGPVIAASVACTAFMVRRYYKQEKAKGDEIKRVQLQLDDKKYENKVETGLVERRKRWMEANNNQ